MLINGLDWSKKEIERQIKHIVENLQIQKERLKRWRKYLKEVKSDGK